MANHTLGTIRGTIEIDYDGAGIVRAVRDTEKAKKELGGIDKASSKVLGAFSSFTKGFLKVGGAINLVTGSAHLLVGALAAIGPLVGAGLAAAPAVILSFASAFAVAKIAVSGVGDALKAAGGDAAKFDEALKKLSPNAQAFAKAVRASVPALKEAKNGIQDAFFQGAAGAVSTIIKRLVSLTAQARGVAFAMGQVAQNVVKTATNSRNIEGLRTILSGVNAFLLQIRHSLGPVVTGFIGLAAQGSKFGGIIGGQVANALAKFAIFLNNIDLDKVFATALPILQSLGGFLKDVGTIAKALFSILIGDGGNAVGVIGNLVSQFAAFLQTAQGTQVLTSIGQALQAIGTGAGQVFLALLQALTPAIIALAPAITQLAGQLTGVLVPAINALAPLLLKLAQFLSDNMSWLGPVAGAVVALAGAYKVYAAAAKVVSAVQDVLQSKIVRNTAAWIANAAAAVATKVQYLALQAVVGVRMVAAWVASTAAMVANRAAGVAVAALMAGQMVASWVASTAAVIANRVAILAANVVFFAARAAVIAWTAVQWLLNAALSANPIGLVVVAVGALIAGIVLLWKHSETFRTIVLAVWAAIKIAIKAVADWFMNTAWPIIKAVIDFIINYYKFLWKTTVTIWTAIFNGVKTAITAIKNVAVAVFNFIVAFIQAQINITRAIITAGINAARAVWNAVLNAIRATARTVWNAIVSIVSGAISRVKTFILGVRIIISYIKNAFTSAKNAAVGQLNSLLNTVRGLPGRISGALGNLGKLLYNKGRDLIRGFINGIGSMLGAVRDKASSIVHAVTDFLPGSPAKTGPLSGKGYVLLRGRRFMNDFAQGINDGSQRPTAALAGAVTGLSRATVPSGSTTKSGASSAAVTPAVTTSGTREYKISIGDKEFASLVVDAITGNPVAVTKANDRGKQLTSWAGSGRK